MIVILFGTDFVLAAECTEVGRMVAAQQNGVLMSSKHIVQDGRNICIVVVIVPAHKGKKLSRVEISIPAD
ncbi:hypothetical protein [Bartonella sp. B41]